MPIDNASAPALDTSLVDSLMNPAAFDHQVGEIELIETHISWVILAGDLVYKIKKPILLDFLDFRDLERRRFFCEEEIRLNQPWAPDIYLDVVQISIVDGQPRFGGRGTAIEYAVRMRRFDQDLRLDAQLESGQLTAADMRELGRNIASRHTAAQPVDPNQRDRVIALTKDFMWDNFTALEGFIGDADFCFLHKWTEDHLTEVDLLLRQRFDDGYVRDCHGDLHLANLVRLPGGITTFDCVEFNTDLRQIDVTCDTAFLIMDLVERRRPDLAAHFLNRYLERTGDYASMRLFSLYFVYRCLVRAKVAVIRASEHETFVEETADTNEANQYCDMAKRQAQERTPKLIVMSGLSGSGKTWVSGQLMSAMPAIRIRSDLERKRMSGLDESEHSESDIEGGLYTRDASRNVYAHLCETARIILNARHNVILDGAFLRENERAMAIEVAMECKAPCTLIAVTAPIELLRQRIRERVRLAVDASEADSEILDYQLGVAEPFTAREKLISINCKNAVDINIDELIAAVRRTPPDLIDSSMP